MKILPDVEAVCERCDGRFLAYNTRARWCNETCRQAFYYRTHGSYKVRNRLRSARSALGRHRAKVVEYEAKVSALEAELSHTSHPERGEPRSTTCAG